MRLTPVKGDCPAGGGGATCWPVLGEFDTFFTVLIVSTGLQFMATLPRDSLADCPAGFTRSLMGLSSEPGLVSLYQLTR